MDDQAFSNQQQMRVNVQYNVTQSQNHHQIQQPRDQFYQQYQQVRQPTFQQQNATQFIHGSQQQTMYNQHSYQVGYSQQNPTASSQYYSMQDDDGIMVAENCVVMTSDPSPDQLLSSQSSGGAHYPPPDQTPNYPYVSVNEGVPASTFYGQVRSQKQHREPHYVVVDPLTYSAGFQQLRSKVPQQQVQRRQLVQSAVSVQRSSAPFEEEEEEMEESDEDIEWQQHSSVQDTFQLKHKVNVNEPRMTRAARRKQYFESKIKPENQKKVEMQRKICSDIFSDEVEKQDYSAQKFEKKTISGNWAVVSPKKDATLEKPLFDKNIAHIQAVQRLSTSEGWRKMNEWLKSSIRTMDLAKLRQLLAQLVDANITVDLLRDNDTPKLIKDLQKCADKEIAIFATKMITKWKSTIRDGNKKEQTNLQQQQHQQTKVKAQKPSGVGVAVVTVKNKRTSNESETDNVPSTSQTVGQVRPRSGSISTAAISHHQLIGNRSNSFNTQKTVASNKTGESSQTTHKPERPKTIAKAKAKISRPRLTGLEGDEPSSAITKSVERSIGSTKTKTSTTVASKTTSPNETPLARIMAATAKFQAEQQPKRKSVEVVFSDNFMDSLSAADVAKPKKAKIVRKKLNEREDSAKFDVRDSSAPVDENDINNQSSLTKKRVRFFDEIGRDLVDVRFFEVEEGERINVTKMGGMDKEAIKHLDSQREKQFLLDARRHGFGTAPASSGSYSSMLMDPSLMPPGHGRIFGNTSQFHVPETRYPWRLLQIECQTIINVEPGSRSEAKMIELERQRTILPALVLPTALPISDIDANELKLQREEGMMQMPKIIPLELVTDVLPQEGTNLKNDEDDSGMNFESLKIDFESTEKKTEVLEHEELMVDETDNEPKLDDYEDYENNDLRSPSPERPPICQIPSSDEDSIDEIKVTNDSLKEILDKNDTINLQEANDGGIASPEPEQLNESIDSGSSSIKEIPIDQLPNSRNLGDEDDKEDLDIRDQGQINLQQPSSNSSDIPSSSSTSLTSAPSTLSSSNLQAFKKIPNLNSLLAKINTIVGTTAGTSSTLSASLTNSAYNVTTPKLEEIKEEACGTALASLNEQNGDKAVDASDKFSQQITPSAIPPPPTPLYTSLQHPFGHPPPGAVFQSTFLPVRLPIQSGTIPPNIQQIMNTPRMFPPHYSDFSIPPPPIPGVRFGFSTQPRLPVSTSNVSSILDSQKQDGGILGQHSEMSFTDKDKSVEGEHEPGQRRQISPGPPGLDEGGSPPPSLEQQNQQKSPSLIQILPSIQQPFSSNSPNVIINQQPQQNISTPQLSLDEAKEIAGVCQFYRRTGTCNFGERCKFAHDDEHLTFGVQMAMRGVSIPNRGGRGGKAAGRVGGIRGSPKVDGEEAKGRASRRETSGKRFDYDISPVRGDSTDNNSVRGARDRRYRRISPPQRRRGRSRSRSRDRYIRRRRSRSRERRRARSSSSSISSRSSPTRSRSSTPQRDRDRKRSRSRSPTHRRNDYSRQRYRRDYYRRRSPRRRSSSSSSHRRRRRSSSSSSSEPDVVNENKNLGGDTDPGSPCLVLSDETVDAERGLKASDSVPIENRE